MIGYLGGEGLAVTAPILAALSQGLSEAGYVDGQNVTIEQRLAEDHYDRLPALAADLISRKVDVIVASGYPAVVRAAKEASQTIPIIFVVRGDPVGAGLVASLARPGGNLTGVSFMVVDVNPKRLELLRELVPQAGLLGVLMTPDGGAESIERNPLERNLGEAARSIGIQLLVLKARTEGEIEASFAEFVQRQTRGVLVVRNPLFSGRREQLVSLAARHALPAIYGSSEYVMDGGLISFGPNDSSVVRQAGIYIGRILKGAKPADLPVQQPTKFELAVNLRTAKALGLTIPPSILARADEVIE